MSSEEESSKHTVSKKDYKKVKKSYEKLQKYCEELNSLKDDLKNQNDLLLEEKQQLEVANKLLSEEVSNLKDELDAQQNYKEETGRKLEKALADFEDVNAKYNQLVSNINQLEDEIESLRKENKDLSEKNKELESKLNGSESSPSTDIYRPDDLDSLKKELAFYKENYEILQQRNEELYNQLRDAQKRESDLEVQLRPSLDDNIGDFLPEEVGIEAPKQRTDGRTKLNALSEMNEMNEMNEPIELASSEPFESGKPSKPKVPKDSRLFGEFGEPKELKELQDSMESLDASGRSDIMQRVGMVPQRETREHEAMGTSLGEIDLSEEDSDKKMDSFSSEESDSSRNTLQSPGEERDRRVEMLKIEIEEIKKAHRNEMDLLRAALDQLLIRYMAIEKSL